MHAAICAIAVGTTVVHALLYTTDSSLTFQINRIERVPREVCSQRVRQKFGVRERRKKNPRLDSSLQLHSQTL